MLAYRDESRPAIATAIRSRAKTEAVKLTRATMRPTATLLSPCKLTPKSVGRAVNSMIAMRRVQTQHKSTCDRREARPRRARALAREAMQVGDGAGKSVMGLDRRPHVQGVGTPVRSRGPAMERFSLPGLGFENCVA